MSLPDLDHIAAMLRDSLPDDSCRAQLGLILYHEMQIRYNAVRHVLRRFQTFGCPVCAGDCASANPPVIDCPIAMLLDVMET